jgi:hypothetical protein
MTVNDPVAPQNYTHVRTICTSTHVRTCVTVLSAGLHAATASKLREIIPRNLDQVLETGVQAEIQRKGRTVGVVPGAPPSKLARPPRRASLCCDPEAIVHPDCSGEWRP